MKKLLIGLCALLLVACDVTTSKAYSFNVETGDEVKIEMDTSGGYNITKEIPFEISKDDEVISEGTFLSEDGVDYYEEAIDTDDDVEIVDEGTKGEVSYIFYIYDDEQYNYFVTIKGAKTGIMLSSTVSEDDAKDVFERLTITVEE